MIKLLAWLLLLNMLLGITLTVNTLIGTYRKNEKINQTPARPKTAKEPAAAARQAVWPYQSHFLQSLLLFTTSIHAWLFVFKLSLATPVDAYSYVNVYFLYYCALDYLAVI